MLKSAECHGPAGPACPGPEAWPRAGPRLRLNDFRKSLALIAAMPAGYVCKGAWPDIYTILHAVCQTST